MALNNKVISLNDSKFYCFLALHFCFRTRIRKEFLERFCALLVNRKDQLVSWKQKKEIRTFYPKCMHLFLKGLEMEKNEIRTKKNGMVYYLISHHIPEPCKFTSFFFNSLHCIVPETKHLFPNCRPMHN